MNRRIAIVGAGVAGLAAGRELARAGCTVTVFEKSRGLGGRVATRRVGDFRLDHGAQVVKAPTAALQALVAAVPGAHELGLPVWVFTVDGQASPGESLLNAEPSWVWPGGNIALAKFLAQDLAVQREVTVGALQRVGGAGEPPCYGLLATSEAALGEFDAVLLTPPAPQTAAILRGSTFDSTTREDLLAALEPVRYRPCVSVALAYTRRPALPWYALLNIDRRHPIAWLACEHAKPGRAPAGAGLLLAQMGPAWSEAHWEALPKGTYGKDATLPASVVEAHTLVRELVGEDLGAPLWADVHRWRYALADAPCGPAAAEGRQGLYIAGDMVAGQGRVHLAIESGLAVARRMLDFGFWILD